MSATATNGQSSVPGGAGAALLMERRRQGLSLGDISRQLKLSVRQVEALERDDYSGFTGPVFVHGFIRNYAKLLSLDPDPLIRAADQVLHPPVPASEPVAAAASPLVVRRRRIGMVPAMSVVAAVAVVVAAVAVLVGTAAARSRRRKNLPQSSRLHYRSNPLPAAIPIAAQAAVKPAAGNAVAADRGARDSAHGLRSGILGGNQGSQRQHHLRATQPGGQPPQRQRRTAFRRGGRQRRRSTPDLQGRAVDCRRTPRWTWRA